LTPLPLRPYHPQTLGKDECFHLTLKAEVLRQTFPGLGTAQDHFDRWCAIYNRERPYESLRMQTPATRYAPSPRSMPEQINLAVV